MTDPTGQRRTHPPTAGDGPVVFTYDQELTDAELAQLRRYVDTANEARVLGQLSATGRVATKGDLRRRATKAARAERERAEAAGEPYQGQVGHAPDTTWTGRPEAYAWHDQTPRVNSSLGAQASHYPVGYQPTEFRLRAETTPVPADLVAVAKLAASSQGRPATEASLPRRRSAPNGVSGHRPADTDRAANRSEQSER